MAVGKSSAKSSKRFVAVLGTGSASNFLCAGSSAFLLLVANFFPGYWYLSCLALIPFLYKITQAAPPAALRLGFLFGLAFFSVSTADSLLTAPLFAVLKLLVGTTLFAVFGWLVGWAKAKRGFNPLLISLLWVIFELGLLKLGLVAGLLKTHQLINSVTFFHGLAVLFGFLAVSFVIVLVNSILVFAIEKTIALAKARGEAQWEIERLWDPYPIPGLFAQKVYLVPQGRAPPVFSL